MSKGGGKGGSTSERTSQTATNFAPFQLPAISRVFDLLGGEQGAGLLRVPEAASGALGNALGFANDLLTGTAGAQRDLLNTQSLINEELAKQPFNDVIDRFETIGNRAEGAFAPFIGLAGEIAERGLDPRAGELLLETAQRDPAANPFIDALVGDVSADVGNAVLDRFVSSGGLEASAAPDAVARAVGRESNRIRAGAFESGAERALRAQQALAQLDAADAAQRLGAAVAGGNLTDQRFGVELGSAGGVLSANDAEEARRNALIGLRSGSDRALADLRLAGLGAIPGLARSRTELPFLPLADFAEIAFAPLGSDLRGTARRERNPGFLETLGTIANIGLSAAGLGAGPGLFGAGSAASAAPVFSAVAGPLARGAAPPPPVFGSPLTGPSIRTLLPARF